MMGTLFVKGLMCTLKFIKDSQRFDNPLFKITCFALELFFFAWWIAIEHYLRFSGNFIKSLYDHQKGLIGHKVYSTLLCNITIKIKNYANRIWEWQKQIYELFLCNSYSFKQLSHLILPSHVNPILHWRLRSSLFRVGQNSPAPSLSLNLLSVCQKLGLDIALEQHLSRYSFVQSQEWKHQNKVSNLL